MLYDANISENEAIATDGNESCDDGDVTIKAQKPTAQVTRVLPTMRQRPLERKHKVMIPESLPMRGKAKYADEDKLQDTKKLIIRDEDDRKQPEKFQVKSAIPNSGSETTLTSLLRQKTNKEK